jgi:hypothetical protein
MTHDEIISIYKEVSNKICNGTEWCWSGAGEPLKLFAQLVAAKEREACAKECEHTAQESDSFTESILRATATQIRARGEQA